MRKALVSLLVVAMLLGLVGTAFAYTDTTGNANLKYIDKASAFKWLLGYPDGSFKPAGNITRAEASAVVVRALGLEAAAVAAKGLGTKFSDVPATHWASGYVNVSVNKGLLKGYPDGTFKPEANVTNAEVITMIVRALSRESDATGEWPIGHITVAAANSIIDAGFASKSLATRADVARYIAKAAEVAFKELTTNGWVETNPAKNFYTANNLVKFTGTIDNVDVVNSKIQITGTITSDSGNYLLATGFGFSGPANMVDLRGYKVDAWKNKDDGRLVFVVSTEAASGSTASGTLASVSGTSFYIGTTQYSQDPANLAKITLNNNNPTTALDLTTLLKTDDEVTIWTGSDGYVTQIKAFRWRTPAGGVITSLQKDGSPASLVVNWKYWDDPTQSYYNTSATFTVADDATISLNGGAAKITDLATDMIVYIAEGASGSAKTIAAYNKTVEGRITAKRYDQTFTSTKRYISIEGVEYRVNSYAWSYDNYDYTGSTSYAGSSTLPVGLNIGDTVKVWLNKDGQIRVWDTQLSVASTGRLMNLVYTPGYDTVLTLDIKGATTKYTVAKSTVSGDPLITSKPKGGYNELYILSLNDKGEVTDLMPAFAAPMAPIPSGTTKASYYPVDYSTTSIWKVTYASSTDKLYTVTNGVTSESVLIGSDSVVYVNGSFGNAASISKDSKVRFYKPDPANSPKASVIEADTYVKYDKSKFTITDTIITGAAGSIEGSTTYGKVKVTVGTGIDSAGALTGAYNIGTNWVDSSNTYGNTTQSWGDATGAFSLKITDSATFASTVYVLITDAYGNSTYFTLTR